MDTRDFQAKEPKLMPFQDMPFNGDPYICREFLMLKREFDIKTAVETGTCLGYTTKWLSQNFEKVITIEVNREFMNYAYAGRLNNCNNVTCHVGDSSGELQNLIQNIDNKTIFFLDAHWGAVNPVKAELQQIANAHITPVIAIHDFFVPFQEDYGYDLIDGKPMNYQTIQPFLYKIYGNNYLYYYNYQVGGAKRGVIYIYPKKQLSFNYENL